MLFFFMFFFLTEFVKVTGFIFYLKNFQLAVTSNTQIN